jgi:Universal stress protein family
MSTHGRRGPGRWVLGSVAEAVTRQALVPILLVRPQPVMPPCAREDAAHLLRQDQYRPEELAQLLAIHSDVVHQAALTGRLHATIVDHHVLSVAREDALRWLSERS